MARARYLCVYLSRPAPPKESWKQKISMKKVIRYASMVTKKHLESPHLAWEVGSTCAVFDVLRHAAKRGKAELRTFDFKTRYILMFHQFPIVRPKQL